MARTTWRILALAALMGAVALPASAQVVIGGSGAPSVEVNWAVLDTLGRQPTLADLLKQDMPVSSARTAINQPKTKAVTYRPYKPAAAPAKAKPAKAAKPAAAKPRAASVVPASAKVEQPAPAKPAPAAESAKPVIAGPPVSLPELPKPAVATQEAPVQVAKAEPAPKAAEPPAPKAVEVPAPKAVEVSAPKAVEPPVSKAVEPPPAPKAEAAPLPLPLSPPPAQVASLPPTPAPASARTPVASMGKGENLSVMFATESARLPVSALPELELLVRRLLQDEGAGLQLLAYAEGTDADASKARRLSLSRALEVRKYLMEQGLRSTRIEVRALGNKLEGGGPADRVDVVVVNR